jgi:hypothetical protein
MTKTRPDPDSEYVSKYLLDFNKRELDKFFHPEKFPKTVLSVAALGIVVFFFVAWMFPLKSQLLNSTFQKDPASASDEKEIQNLTISGPQTAKKGDQFSVLVTIKSDLKPVKEMQIDIDYPSDSLILLSAKPLSVPKGESSLTRSENNLVGIDYKFSQFFQTSGTPQEILVLTFVSKKAGRVNLTTNNSSWIKDFSGQNISIWKNNYTLLISE